jgi:hypothetical protein
VQVFRCQWCGQRTFFPNVRCERCGTMLGFLPGRMELWALHQAEGVETPDDPEDDVWTPVDLDAGGRFRRCGNWIDHDVCNWMVPSGLPDRLCAACRLNEVIPDLGAPGNLERWARLEAAKRRVIYNLLHLGLPVVPRTVDPERGLAFRFMADPPEGEGPPVMTGHAGGVVTINVAEADDAVREQRRVQLGEPYRTLVGHLRHELGHYYWDRLVAPDEDVLAAFRALFGDERQPYQEALQRHYDQGPPPEWRDRFVTAYATMHPWEDWAETWAHYLHMTATLETAESMGVSASGVSDDPAAPGASGSEGKSSPLRVLRIGSLAPEPEPEGGSFDALLVRWLPLTLVLNELNRSMGTLDPYPFVLSTPAIEKLRFVHEVVAGKAGDGPESSPGA